LRIQIIFFEEFICVSVVAKQRMSLFILSPVLPELIELKTFVIIVSFIWIMWTVAERLHYVIIMFLFLCVSVHVFVQQCTLSQCRMMSGQLR